MDKEQSLNKTIAQIWEDKYVVPLYQRNFAWAEEQIGQLLQDIYDHAPKSDSDDCGNYYLGSLVVLERKDGVWEVIDGQQRLTCLHLICKYLDILKKTCLTYDSRPEVERFFTDLFSKSWDDFIKEYDKIDIGKISRLKDALRIVESYKIRTGSGDKNISLKEMTLNQRNLLAKYILSKVVLVRIPLPQDTDVASYFEIMNNRGEQLQSHEIVKAMLMQGLGDNERNIFATIWDGCSQMNLPIQQTLSHYRGKGLFGTNFDSLIFDCIVTIENELGNVSEKRTIEDILNDNPSDNKWLSNELEEEPDVKYRAIIDFPNFLMHVFRLYKSKKVNTSDDTEIPLNADSMPTEKPYYITDSMDFIKFLLKVRTFFDRYVIKMQGDDEDDENLKWRMLRPYRYEYNGRQTLKSKNTFSGSDDNDNEDEKYSRNSRVIKQQSMLQVTFRQRKYKRWLYDLLYWLCDNNVETVAEEKLSEYLDKWIVDYYKKLIDEWKSKPNDIMCAGTDTPHFLLNFIDYLYWIASRQNETTIRYAKKINEFQFKYYNSVEHHLPKSYENTNKDNLDKIGNLCLISKRKNSSLNAKGPTEKAKIEPGLQPNRSVMYQITHDYGKWGDTEIEAHQRDINDLLDQIPLLIRK